ncbi:MAG: Asp-tRNA(Asn)/Glu-tRNA(Gln) amidotransferase subunit GatB [Firmicutes bacterium]|nr:Asp-tRNA(Asn)/Glu-tRNA(Gln) amidotransferase subunit GatB [Bacillota bacterium]
MAEYEVIIGLEVHAELLTQSKLFCRCSTKFGQEPNTQVCPVCLGLPGTLPVLNSKAVEYTIRAGLALNCTIADISKFDRKNYFYPDLPKAYQVSQFDLPLCREGYIDIATEGGSRRIGINRIHLEEEAGKLMHAGDNIVGAEYSLVDYNRGGIPLIEIVSEPDLRSPEEARLYLDQLKSTLQYIGVSDCKMQEGSLRCDANISLRRKGERGFGVKSEIKNLNSFRAVQRALEYEVKRQRAELEAGATLIPDTRHWDEERGITVQMRTKEEADDYRYFPDPDLMPITIESSWVEEIRATIPELPQARRERFIQEYQLPEYDAQILTVSRELADFFEECVKEYADPKPVSNWIMGELLRVVNPAEDGLGALAITPTHLVSLLKLIDEGTISGSVGKDVFAEMIATGNMPEDIVAAKGLKQISDVDELMAIVEQVIADNPKSVSDYRAGKTKALGFLVGQVMRATKGQANPQKVNELLVKGLEG